MKRFLFYNLRWQLGGIVIAPVLWLLLEHLEWNYILSMFLMQIFGAAVFYPIDMWIAKQKTKKPMVEQEEMIEEVIESVYRQYYLEHDMDGMRYIHPMFYNGTFSKDNEYQPPKPEPLMTKAEFRSKLGDEDMEKWDIAIQVLYTYISKQ